MVRRRGSTTSSERGQALVEFALVLPVFLLLIFGIVEFGFLYNAAVSVNFASRVAALLAAEGGRTEGTDCMVLRAIEADMATPATPTRISQVEIYWSDANGDQIASNVNVYTRTGSLTCAYASGSITVPYTLANERYPEPERCDVIAGCGGLHAAVHAAASRGTHVNQRTTDCGRAIPSAIGL